jgi:hypothetical protein
MFLKDPKDSSALFLFPFFHRLLWGSYWTNKTAQTMDISTPRYSEIVGLRPYQKGSSSVLIL